MDEGFEFIGNNTCGVLPENINELVCGLMPAVGWLGSLGVEEEYGGIPGLHGVPYEGGFVVGARSCACRQLLMLIDGWQLWLPLGRPLSFFVWAPFSRGLASWEEIGFAWAA